MNFRTAVLYSPILLAAAISGCSKPDQGNPRALEVARKFVRVSIDSDPQAAHLVQVAKQSFGMDLILPMENCMEQSFLEANVTPAELDALESVFDGNEKHKQDQVPASVRTAMASFRECLDTTASMMRGGLR